MNKNLALSLVRADELLKDLNDEYNRSLHQQEVSLRAVHLTHEVCAGLRGILDRVARQYWDQYVSPQLTPENQKGAKVYFPISGDQAAFESTIGRWQWKSIRSKHQAVYDYLLGQQPFRNPAQKWLPIVNNLALGIKHTDLIPQKRTSERRITVSRPGGGSVRWGSGVTFHGHGISVMGAPIDPLTQRIVPTPGVIEHIEEWVSFVISGHNVNALEFCQEACRETRRTTEEMSAKFGLS